MVKIVEKILRLIGFNISKSNKKIKREKPDFEIRKNQELYPQFHINFLKAKFLFKKQNSQKSHQVWYCELLNATFLILFLQKILKVETTKHQSNHAIYFRLIA